MLATIAGWVFFISMFAGIFTGPYAISIAPHSLSKLWDPIRTHHFRHWLKLGAPDRLSEFLTKRGVGGLDKELKVLETLDDPEINEVIEDLQEQDRFQKRIVLPIALVALGSGLLWKFLKV